MRVLITIFFLCSKYWYVYGDGDDDSVNTIHDSTHNFSDGVKRFNMEEDFFVRAPKFLSFNKESNKLRVEAAFAVPLLSIPLGGETANVHGGNAASVTVPKVDINLKSVVAVGSIFLVVFVILPKLLQFHSPLIDNFRSYGDTTNTMLSDAAKLLSESLERHNMGLESCTQKAVCWAMNRVATRINEGKANGPEKLVDAISSMPSLKYVFGDTWLWPLLQQLISFRNSENKNCEQFDQKCFITSKGISSAAGSLLAAFTKSRKL